MTEWINLMSKSCCVLPISPSQNTEVYISALKHEIILCFQLALNNRGYTIHISSKLFLELNISNIKTQSD